MLVDVNGEILAGEEAKVSALDAGLYFGLGIYETLLVKQGVPIFYSDHMQRFSKALDFMEFPTETDTVSLVRDRIARLLAGSKKAEQDFRLRILATPGQVLIPDVKFSSLNVVLYLIPLPSFEVKPTTLLLSNLTKNVQYVLPSYVKLTSNNKNLISAREARERGADEALLVNERGVITEGSFSNFFFVRDGSIYTASEETNLLAGITRQKVIELSESHKIPISVGEFAPAEIENAEEAFITSSTRGVVPVERVIGASGFEAKFAQTRVSDELRSSYDGMVEAYITAEGPSWK